MNSLITVIISVCVTVLQVLAPVFSFISEKTPTEQATKQPQLIVDSSFTARSIVMFDERTGDMLLNHHGSDSRPIASLSKIMTGYIALKELDPQATIYISPEAESTFGSVGGFKAGESFALRDAFFAMMMMSSNDVAMAIAETVGKKLGGKTFDERIKLFVERMNQEAKYLGMTNTHFKNPTGLDLDSGNASNYSTAQDLSRLIAATESNSFLWEASREMDRTIVSKEGTSHHVFNLNNIASEIPHFVGSKTGTTDASGESLVILYEYPLGEHLGLVLLGADPGRRFPEAQALLLKAADVLK